MTAPGIVEPQPEPGTVAYTRACIVDDIADKRAQLEGQLEAYLRHGRAVAELRRHIARREAELAALPP